MSKSLARVTAALQTAGLTITPLEMPSETRTAQQAATAAGVALDQIVKSILFAGANSGRLFLFLTAGGNQVDPTRAATLAGEALARQSGGVAPVGHLTPLPTWLDPRLMEFPLLWAAAGTPRHIFPIAPADLYRLTGATLAPFTA